MIEPHHFSHALARALAFMAARRSSAIGLSDIAAAAGVSARTLQYAFQDALGRSPGQHLRRLRLEGARADLERDGISSLAEIAAKWRFTNQTRFVAYFQQAYGVHPAQVRPGARGAPRQGLTE